MPTLSQSGAYNHWFLRSLVLKSLVSAAPPGACTFWCLLSLVPTPPGHCTSRYLNSLLTVSPGAYALLAPTLSGTHTSRSLHLPVPEPLWCLYLYLLVPAHPGGYTRWCLLSLVPELYWCLHSPVPSLPGIRNSRDLHSRNLWCPHLPLPIISGARTYWSVHSLVSTPSGTYTLQCVYILGPTPSSLVYLRRLPPRSETICPMIDVSITTYRATFTLVFRPNDRSPIPAELNGLNYVIFYHILLFYILYRNKNDKIKDRSR